MPSTYSPNLRIELIANGEQSGTWGSTTNNNLGTLIEDAISGYVSVSITSANQALTALNGAEDQSRNMVINLTTTTGANFNVYIPPVDKVYIVRNSSLYSATIFCSTVLGNTTAAGTGATIPAGRETLVFADGTNVSFGIDHLPSLTLTTDLAVADGGTGASDAAGARTNLGLGTMATQAASGVAITGGSMSNVSITGGSISGITDLAITDGGTGASTASGARTNLGLGTISTQDANNVSITGGSISGITDLAIADGGTGASDVATARSNLGTVSDPGSNGILARTSSNTTTARSITAGTGITVSDGGGVSGNPVITNAGVTSLAAGTGIALSGSTGGVTISSTSLSNYVLQVYTSNATWSKPAGLKAIKVTVVGAGGNGGVGSPSQTGGGGGGGGAAILYLTAASVPSSVAVTAGAGTNSFGALCSATAGAVGGGGNGGGGSGGLGAGGNLNIGGDGGQGGINAATSQAGKGGSSILGGGGASSGGAGRNYGGGGAGVQTGSGGAGANGVVIVEEFY